MSVRREEIAHPTSLSPGKKMPVKREEEDEHTAVSEPSSARAAAGDEQLGDAPKKLDRGRTVCDERNAKGKLCNGHLKQLRTGGQAAREHLRGQDVPYRCQICGTLYVGPPLGHLRDSEKQSRFVQHELMDILRAAGGTLPFFGSHQTASASLNSSPAADAHRPAAEAQAATGQASAVPLSPAAATASPVAGPESASDLAPDPDASR